METVVKPETQFKPEVETQFKPTAKFVREIKTGNGNIFYRFTMHLADGKIVHRNVLIREGHFGLMKIDRKRAKGMAIADMLAGTTDD